MGGVQEMYGGQFFVRKEARSQSSVGEAFGHEWGEYSNSKED